jgi:hypothetical protein
MSGHPPQTPLLDASLKQKLATVEKELELKEKERVLLENSLRDRERQWNEAMARCSKLSALIVSMAAERFGQRL